MNKKENLFFSVHVVSVLIKNAYTKIVTKKGKGMFVNDRFETGNIRYGGQDHCW